MSEQVLVVPEEVAFENGQPNGFSSCLDSFWQIFDEKNQLFMDREEAEENPKFKQLIPYVIIQRGDLCFSYYRGKVQGEKRLHGKRSVGVGGHINPIDDYDVKYDRYTAAVLRELNEEIRFQPPATYWSFPPIGVIYDGKDDVGQVHLGVVHKLILPLSCSPTGFEDGILSPTFLAASELEAKAEDFEGWSQSCLEHGLCRPSFQIPRNPLFDDPPCFD